MTVKCLQQPNCVASSSGEKPPRATVPSQSASVCNIFTVVCATREPDFGDQLDRCFAIMRNVSRDDELNVVGRLRLLEVNELRAGTVSQGDEDLNE
ncbi:hypothetical protein HPB52_006778 [Rhipicephalus sanguineus]|uniref:Uncharacterized protein n=1 Tax=Rhipicephalus sanguineus TaxID=34632 RepID=A0A9D4T8W3_RHISA|nr:hypothetical protein HPB52_006778 [Rhipicephalus sanguineus]